MAPPMRDGCAESMHMCAQPVACNLHAFDPSQHQRYQELLAAVAPHVRGTRDLADGFEIQLSADDDTLMNVVEFAALERRCCPFLTFTIELAPRSALLLRLTGPQGAKEILSEFVWISASATTRLESNI